MKALIAQPRAASIVGSLRSIGYSFDTAVADIVDNSISAKSSNIWISVEHVTGKPSITFLDDGEGMTESRLIEAMRHGGLGILKDRSENDLGRYGLGLKTASLSQCRRLTVATIALNGSLAVARWDLDRIESDNEWLLLLPTQADIIEFHAVRELLQLRRGTVVIWELFDLALSGASNQKAAIETLLHDSEPHLSLVFQRFLKRGDSKNRVTIFINYNELSGIDPFLVDNPKTQQLPTENVKIGNAVVSITAFILPQLKYMSPTEIARLGGPSGIRQGQGFYVYRGKRLVIAGTWFKMLRFEELSKLARVRIDIPNSLDSLWNLDVKKSTANPPEAVKRVLKRILDRITERSTEVFRDRSTRNGMREVTPVWVRRTHGDGVSYVVNRLHPLISQFLNDVPNANRALAERAVRLIEMCVPYSTIITDANGGAAIQRDWGHQEKTLTDLLHTWIARCGSDKAMRKSLLEALPSLEPFSQYPELTAALAERHRDGVA